MREAVRLTFCAFSLSFSVLLSEREILTLPLSVLLLIRASVLLEHRRSNEKNLCVFLGWLRFFSYRWGALRPHVCLKNIFYTQRMYN